MKPFQTVKSKLSALGYCANKRPFNRIQLIFLLKSVLANISFGVYLFYVADAPKEFLDSIFMFTVGILILISDISTISKTTIIFEFIAYGEKVANKSMYSFGFLNCDFSEWIFFFRI